MTTFIRVTSNVGLDRGPRIVAVDKIASIAPTASGGCVIRSIGKLRFVQADDAFELYVSEPYASVLATLMKDDQVEIVTPPDHE